MKNAVEYATTGSTADDSVHLQQRIEEHFRFGSRRHLAKGAGFAVVVTMLMTGCGGGPDSPAAPGAAPDDRLAPYPLDRSFGSYGTFVLESPLASSGRPQVDIRGVLAAADGGVWAVGVVGPVIASGIILKLDATGRPDSVCGVSGMKTFDSVAGLEKPFFNRIRRAGSDNALYVGGAVGFRAFAARLDPTSCSLDPAFGTKGAVVMPDDRASGDTESFFDVDEMGRTYLVSNKGGFSFIARYTSNGTLDNAFGSSGVVVIEKAGGFISRTIVSAPDGSVYLGGQATKPFGFVPVVTKLSPSGTLDANFGDQGFASVDQVSKGTASVLSLLRLADGRLLAAGTTAAGVAVPDSIATNDSFVVRLTSAGGLEPSFGQGGWLRWDWGFENSNPLVSLLSRADGRIAACGHVFAGAPYLTQWAAIVHFNLDGSFAGLGPRAGRALARELFPVECRQIAEDAAGRLLLGGGLLPSKGFIARTQK